MITFSMYLILGLAVGSLPITNIIVVVIAVFIIEATARSQGSKHD